MDSVENSAKRVLISNLTSADECKRKAVITILADRELFRLFCIAVTNKRRQKYKLK